MKYSFNDVVDGYVDAYAVLYMMCKVYLVCLSPVFPQGPRNIIRNERCSMET